MPREWNPRKRNARSDEVEPEAQVLARVDIHRLPAQEAADSGGVLDAEGERLTRQRAERIEPRRLVDESDRDWGQVPVIQVVLEPRVPRPPPAR